MKRLGVLFAFAFLGLMMAGCESPATEGPPTDAPQSSMTDLHKEAMKNMAEKMKMPKGRPKNAGTATATQ